MMKTFLRLAVALFAAFIIVTGFATEETYALQGSYCIATGCSAPCSRKSWFCHEHECSERGCHHMATEQGYCSTHAPKTNNSYYNKRSSSNKNSSKMSTGNTYSKSEPKSKKNYYDMPDCDDYEDYDDFMDDWDGCMPDDSDAEDYWDNW